MLRLVVAVKLKLTPSIAIVQLLCMSHVHIHFFHGIHVNRLLMIHISPPTVAKPSVRNPQCQFPDESNW